MKVVHVNLMDISGGASKAAYRLHQALLKEGIQSRMVVQLKEGDDFSVVGPGSKKERFMAVLRPFLDRIPLFFYRQRERVLFSPSFLRSKEMVDKVNALCPDIVHFHWICGGTMRIEEIPSIEAPVVWSLHDMWPFTGGCHYSGECEKFLSTCNRCPLLKSSMPYDLSRWIFWRKMRAYRRKRNIKVIGLSRWITELSQESALLGRFPHVNLPNLIDTTLYKPIDRKIARELWHFPQDKKLILFGAVSATQDRRKGFKELCSALSNLPGKENVELVVFGSGRPNRELNLEFPIHYVGHLKDDIALVTLYNAVDAMIVPSLQENLSNTVMESLSCGIPVAAFRIGGNNDMIEHLYNGYLAKAWDIEDLSQGIAWILNHEDYKSLSMAARESACKKFDERVVSKRYIEFYKQVLHE